MSNASSDKGNPDASIRAATESPLADPLDKRDLDAEVRGIGLDVSLVGCIAVGVVAAIVIALGYPARHPTMELAGLMVFASPVFGVVVGFGAWFIVAAIIATTWPRWLRLCLPILGAALMYYVCAKILW
jgi:hypothetical protein